MKMKTLLSYGTFDKSDPMTHVTSTLDPNPQYCCSDAQSILLKNANFPLIQVEEKWSYSVSVPSANEVFVLLIYGDVSLGNWFPECRVFVATWYSSF
jgi:hypothetical protein